MTSAPAFATKWEFLWADVLVGFDPERELMCSVQGEQGPLLCLWTDEGAAERALPSGYRLMRTPTRPRLQELPDGVGIVVDQGTDAAMVIAPGYAAELKRLVTPFPEGAMVRAEQWELPPAAADAVRTAAAGYSFVTRVWALRHTIDDSPPIGDLVYECDAGPEAQESAADALLAALHASGTPGELAVLGAHVLSVRDLPGELGSALGRQEPFYAAVPR